MAQKRKRIRIIIIILLFFTYFFLAARPVPREIILAPGWISSLTSSSHVGSSLVNNSLAYNTIESGSLDGDQAEEYEEPDNVTETQSVNFSDNNRVTNNRNLQYLPFNLGSHFGYVDISGQFIIKKVITDNIYLSRNMWTEYASEPSNILIKNTREETIINIDPVGAAQGYPILLDDRIFIISSDQNSLSEIDKYGNIVWSYEFGAPLTCIDARAGLLLAGSLDGIIEIFNYTGERIFYFEPGGSRYAVILGCAISHDGSRIGIISGIDQQRFLLLERFGNTGGDFKVVYHEYLDTGFRRPVRILFIDEDQRIVFERTGGIGCYNIRYRRGIFIPLDGEIYAVEDSGDRGYFFLVTSHGLSEKKLVGIRFSADRWLPFSVFPDTDTIFMKAPFKSNDVFLSRIRLNDNGSMIVVGGGQTLISFTLEEK